MQVNRQKFVVNLAELTIVRRAFGLAYRPGLCARTILAGIVATGSLQGLDLSQEAAFIEPSVAGLADRPRLTIAR